MPAILVSALLCSCNGNLDYDTSKGINTEMTLFQEEISVPIGSIGPLTIGSALDKLNTVPGIGSMVSQFIQVGEDGYLRMDDKGSILRINAYELEKLAADPSKPFTWNAGYQFASVGGMVGALAMLGLKTVNQHLTITASNPFFEKVPMKCKASISCRAADYTTSYTAPIPELSSCQLESANAKQKLATIDIPANITDIVSTVTLEDLTFDLPEKMTSTIDKTSNNLLLGLSYEYYCRVAVGEKLNLPIISGPIKGVDLPLGQFRLKKCRVTVELVNTLPLSVIVKDVKVLKPVETEGAEAEPDSNISITPGEIKIEGGSEEKPATSRLTLEFEAAEGTIPDIKGLRADITIAGQPGMNAVPLTTKQGLYVKSSSAKLSGGITIPQQLLQK